MSDRLKAARVAIERVFSDTSVPTAVTREHLEALRLEIDECLAALSDDEANG
jgi:hypothetical protein